MKRFLSRVQRFSVNETKGICGMRSNDNIDRLLITGGTDTHSFFKIAFINTFFT